MSYVDVIRTGIETGLKDADNGLSSVERYGPDVIRRLVNVYLSTIPLGFLAESEIAHLLIEELISAVTYAREAVSKLAEATEALGSPDALRAAAAVIGESIEAPGKQLVLTVTAPALQGVLPENWNSDASARYGRDFSGLLPMLPQIGTQASALSQVLSSLADGIENYYLQLAAAVATFVAGCIGVAISIASAAAIVTIPFSAVGLVGSAIAVIGSLIGLAAIFVALSQQMHNDIDSLDSANLAWPPVGFSL